MNETELEAMFKGLPEVEPSADFMRRVRTIPLTHERTRFRDLFAWPFTRTISTFAAALAVGLIVGGTLPDESVAESDWATLVAFDSESVIDSYSELE